MTTWDFTGCRALVTGASSGIGRATALLCAGAGAHVMATGRQAGALGVLAREAEHLPGKVVTRAGDVTDAGFRRALVADATAQLGGLDLLVNAAGIIASADWEKTTLDDWDRMLDVNLRSVFALCQLAIPHLQASRGAIVNVSSVTGTRAFPGVLAYCVSKAGVDQLTRCLALELAPYGVRVNAVNPGVVRSNLHRAGGMNEERYRGFLEHSKTTHPLGRIGEPADIAAAIAFLASPQSGWITGETIAVDGGRHQTCAR
jgi:NAD(P)-dependent dehydrogenase (short-subunit alcohol dehydrogenase family)